MTLRTRFRWLDCGVSLNTLVTAERNHTERVKAAASGKHHEELVKGLTIRIEEITRG